MVRCGGVRVFGAIIFTVIGVIGGCSSWVEVDNCCTSGLGVDGGSCRRVNRCQRDEGGAIVSNHGFLYCWYGFVVVAAVGRQGVGQNKHCAHCTYVIQELFGVIARQG